ncbi:transposase family protein [Halomonas sp. G15]|nr:transposase family protein [Halomonas sp. G15]MCE0731814.1 transposase family protein [Halomonas sp. G15]
MPRTAVPILNIFASVTDPRHPSKVQHPLPDLLTVAVCGVLAESVNIVGI